MRLRVVIVIAALAGGASSIARAESADPEPSLQWNERWQRTTGWHIGTSLAMAGVAMGLQFTVSPERHWTGGILFDVPARNALRPESERTRDTIALTSDVVYFSLWAYPLVIDSALVAWAIHDSPDVAQETFWISFQSLAATCLAVSSSISVVGRQRPRNRGCENDPTDTSCDDKFNNQSFFSGHTAVSFTTAGLLCTHHAKLPLYGGGWPETLTCALSMGAAAAVGTFRIVADRHYASDVLTGATVGLATGLLMPRLLHYGFGDDDAGPRVSLIPQGTASVQGLTLVGAF